MDDSSQATVRSRSTMLKGGTFDDDQCFLLYFIMGIYFGPHIKGERNQKSVLQRVAEGLPPYTYDQLTKSVMRLAEFEHIYYYALREADKSVVVKLAWLRQYFQGDISCLVHNSAARYPQFADLFPPQLHPQSLSKNRSKIIENIVFISNPETSYINPDDIERLRRLSGLEDLHLSRCPVRLHASLDSSAQYNVQEAEPNGKRPHIQSNSDSQNGDRNYFKLNLSPHPHAMASMSGDMAPLPSEEDSDPGIAGPAMIFLPSPPTKKELSEIVSATKSGFALTGSAAMRQVGPIIGLMDIGECEDSYIFRVSLPGVKRDESDFSCEVDTDGKVLIRGVTTTGEKTVCRYSQVFEMETQNLCPPGHFSVSFQLPGPVDPCQFSGNFGTDGILEGVVLKGPNTN